MQAIITLPGGC